MSRRKRKTNSDPRSNANKYGIEDTYKNKDKGSKSEAAAPSKEESKPSEKPDRPGTSEKKEEVPQGNGPMYKGQNSARSANNDPEWYAKDAQMVIDVASIPFSEPLGSKVSLQNPGELYAVATDDNTKPGMVAANSPVDDTIHGICTCVTKSSFGTARDIRDPINVCATALYSHVRVVNSGRKNYDPSDLFIYCASMADVYSYIMWATRVYAKAFIYSQRNQYVGKALLESEYIDADDIVNNLANFRYWLNALINKISAYAVPADIAYFQRRAWMYSHVYLENPDANIKDQLYQFSPDGFYRFELDSAGIGCLMYSRLTEILGHTNKMKASDIRAIGEWLMGNVTNDEDFGLMSGDIIKAFNGNIIGLASIPEYVDLVPVYSEYVLLQIKNGGVIPASRGSTAIQYDELSNGVALKCGNVYQDEKGILNSIEGFDYALNSGSGFESLQIGMRKVLTVNTPTPNPIDVMEISRLLPGGAGVLNIQGANNKPIVKLATGADVIVQVLFAKFDNNGDLTYAKISNNVISTNTGTDNNGIFTAMSKFKYAPLMYGLKWSGTGYSNDPYIISEVELISEVDNYTIIDWAQLYRLHEVAMLSLFWVPGIAKMVNF